MRRRGLVRKFKCKKAANGLSRNRFEAGDYLLGTEGAGAGTGVVGGPWM